MVTRAIILDLDETLIEDSTATDRAFETTCSYAAKHINIDAKALHVTVHSCAEELWRGAAMFSYCDFLGISASEGLWGNFVITNEQDRHMQQLAQWLPSYRYETWRRALAQHGVEHGTFAQKLADLFREERSSNYQCFPEVETALQQLRSKYKLGMLTNGAASVQQAKIERMGLGQYFDGIVVSGEVGIGKPNPEVFTAALAKLAVEPREAVMVGDNISRDILGSYRSHMRGIWINRTECRCTIAAESMMHAKITCLDELAYILLSVVAQFVVPLCD